MSDIKKLIDNPGTSDPDRADREYDLENWNEEQAREKASVENLELTDAHWEVIHYLRDYYLEHGRAKSGRHLSNALEKQFIDRGGRKYLRQLFPDGPVAQGMVIAGLEVPPLTEDDGFGISF
ncbi:TusE/DsrC/DsvC family sulfur relay protein [Sulfuriflexus sp.]|uniref:TusE/DsrC/DsvC family sulfur relay protein n=1 Tax=Sulfuriflexus sp. TaxID=2015443 RepID=UPI0028CCBA6F|nr:TusE/DsrC/DsvC family sulfur relay protein [Sulfuriflexus sp.]MDT8405307.1 TusE/DsrC/DsvC family sulfur relay protein [Sulfuriflexus sp.]